MIIQVYLEIYDLWKDVWVGGWMGGELCKITKNRINLKLFKIFQFCVKI